MRKGGNKFLQLKLVDVMKMETVKKEYGEGKLESLIIYNDLNGSSKTLVHMPSLYSHFIMCCTFYVSCTMFMSAQKKAVF